MNRREIVRGAIRFESPDRLPFDLPDPYGSDIVYVNMSPSPNDRPPAGKDEWGALWVNLGHTRLGEVKEYPLTDWTQLSTFQIPDITLPHRWQNLARCREQAGDRYILAEGISIYARVHYLRGLEATWMDIYDHPDELGALLDILVEMNLQAIQRYAAVGVDGFIIGDDWGLQNKLMIAPRAWRQLWKPRYERIFAAVHQAGMDAFLHSCGHIVSILDDLIEIGLDVVHMDQQENMGLELLGERFGGRLTFYSPVDIQKTMASGDLAAIRAYARRMARLLGRPQGGFIPRWYTDPKGAGHTPAALAAMSEEFLALSQAFPNYFDA